MVSDSYLAEFDSWGFIKRFGYCSLFRCAFFTSTVQIYRSGDGQSTEVKLGLEICLLIGTYIVSI